MIKIISSLVGKSNLLTMPSEMVKPGAARSVHGSGEFQLHDIYVVAEVEIRAGTIDRVRFHAGDGDDLAGGEEIAAAFIGQRINRALELKIDEYTLASGKKNDTFHTALFEAFHRAIETCIDEAEES